MRASSSMRTSATRRSFRSRLRRISAAGPTITPTSFNPCTVKRPTHASLRSHNFFKRLPALPSPTPDCQDYPALVRRFGCRVERGHDVLPDLASGRIRLRARGGEDLEAAHADDGARHAAADQLPAAAHSA